MKVAVRRFSAGASAGAGARFECKGTPFLHSQSQMSKSPQNYPNPDASFHVNANDNPPNSLSRILSDSDRLLRSGPFAPTFCFNKLLISLSRMGHHANVLSLFREMGLRRVCFDLLTLNIVIKSCCCCLNLKHGVGVSYGMSLAGAIVKNGYQPDAVTFNTLIKGLFLEGRSSDAFRLFHKLSEYCQPSVVTYGTVIDGLCKLGNVEMGFGFLGEMVKKGVEINAFIFTALIKGLFYGGDANVAVKWFCKLRQVLNDASPDHVTYGTVIDGLCKIGNLGMAFCLLGEMVKKGAVTDLVTFNSCHHLNLNHRIGANSFYVSSAIVNSWRQPESAVFTSLLKGLFLKGETVDALRLFHKCSRYFQPDVVNYGTVIDGLCETGNTDMAFSLLGKMVKNGVKPNVVIFNTLIKGLCFECKANDALKLFHELPQVFEDVKPDHVTYGTVIDGLCKMGNVNVAFSLLGEMVKKDVMINVVTLGTLIKGLFSKGEANAAVKLFCKLPKVSKDVQHNKITYGIAIDGLCKNGNVGVAIDLLRDMKSSSCYPDTPIYSSIMDGLCKKRRVDDAFSFLGRMFKIGVPPDIVTYSIMINGLCTDGKLKHAWKLFNHLSVEGIQPTVFTYTIIINGLCQEGYLWEAKELLLKMEESGCEPNEVTYNIIVHGFLRWNQRYEAMELLQKMVSRKLSPVASAISKVVDILDADRPNHEARFRR